MKLSHNNNFLDTHAAGYMNILYTWRNSTLKNSLFFAIHMKNQNSLNHYMPVSEVVSVYKSCKVFVVIHENLKSFSVILNFHESQQKLHAIYKQRDTFT